MPKTRTNVSGDASERLVESDERVDLEGDNDPEETIEEEVEYEEVEEEEEVEVEEEEEEEEEDPEEEVEEEDDNKRPAAKSNGQKSSDGDEEMIVADAEDDEEKKDHAELITCAPLQFETLKLKIILNWKYSLFVFLSFLVRAVYVKNLPKDITQDQLKDLFEHHGKITKVVLPPAKAGQEKSRFGFVHFAERACAMKALKNTEKYEIDGLNFLQPLIYGRGPTPAGMAMMPMLLPDGRIGYPGVQPQMPPPQSRGGRSGGGGSSSGGRQSGESSRGRSRYNPY
ncbi:polyadenylate-binding protein 4-like [Pyrus ussuriensis x Pyrus communis]|uniref:Polyadenylate-binding protein 4-like n=1 Tax=Pyrus ussuriensis x Pyrus communis TaxID=2448454 RepID=A0A5N5HZB5_9ROSA|nr:polyadenylate-binding protein 4-like [Pyrus ussuriensis x Pyrus communis]